MQKKILLIALLSAFFWCNLPCLDQVVKDSEEVSVYQCKIESDSADVIKLDNGAIVRISLYFGYVSYENAMLFYSASHWNLWIEGKEAFLCHLIQSPNTIPIKGLVKYIFSVQEKGEILKLSDGTIYKVNSKNLSETKSWSTLNDVLILNQTTMINFEKGVMIQVRKIKLGYEQP